MRRLKIGPCPVCNRRIWTMEGANLKMTDEGTHFWIRSNYNTVARFAICKECLKTLNMAKIAEIVDRQALTWIQDLLFTGKLVVEEDVNRKQFDKYRFYVAADWADNEEEILEKCKQASS